MSEGIDDETTSSTAAFHHPRPKSKGNWIRENAGGLAVTVAAAAIVGVVTLIIQFESRVTRLETQTAETLPNADDAVLSELKSVREDLRALRDRIDRHLENQSPDQ